MIGAGDDRRVALELDMRAETRELLHMHEAVLENRLGDARDALGARHQRHELRLQIGREGRKRRRLDVDRRDAGAIARDAQALVCLGHAHARQGHHVQRRLQDVGARAGERHVAAGHRHGHRIGARLYAVGHDRMMRAMERGHALDLDRRLARAGDARAHFIEALREIDDLGFARGVAQHRRSVRERGRHQRRMRAADRDFRKFDLGADEAFFRRADDIAVLDLDPGAEFFQSHQQKIDGPRADRAAAGKRHAALAHAGEQRREDPEARAHARDEFVGRGGVDNLAGGQMHGAAGIGGLSAAFAGDRVIDAMIAEDAFELRHIGEQRHVGEGERVARQERGDHQRQGGVLGAGNRNDAVELRSADDPDLVHHPSLSFFGAARSARSRALRRARLARSAVESVAAFFLPAVEPLGLG